MKIIDDFITLIKHLVKKRRKCNDSRNKYKNRE